MSAYVAATNLCTDQLLQLSVLAGILKTSIVTACMLKRFSKILLAVRIVQQYSPRSRSMAFATAHVAAYPRVRAQSRERSRRDGGPRTFALFARRNHFSTVAAKAHVLL
jgi:hypothetical protein